MRKDAGIDGDAQCISQLAWLIFLKIFDDNEKELELGNDNYRSPLPDRLRWRAWAANDEGITGDDLLDFVNNDLFKELKNLKVSDDNPRGVLVRTVFEDAYNYMKSGTLLRQVINKINEIDFTRSGDRHLFNDLYEKILRDLQSAGNAGEFYTPRPVTQFIVDVVNPRLGEKVLDPASGTGGFLVCTLEHLRKQVKGVEDNKLLGESLNGIEKKPMPHLLCVTNLILHGIEVPNVKHQNSFDRPIRDYKAADKVDVIVTNPPFGGEEEDIVLSNFPSNYRTKETADLFLVMIMHLLKEKGRCGLVLPDGFLFGEGAKTRIKEQLLSEFNLHTIVRLPNGVFAPYTDIRTNLLFFERGSPTKDVWYFEHPLPDGYKKYSKTKPIQEGEFQLEKDWWNNREENEHAWKVTAEQIRSANYNLDIKNPNSNDTVDDATPAEIIAKLLTSNTKVREHLEALQKELK
jgi:type I restriction enzyme M protein